MPLSNRKWKRATEEEPIQEQILNFLRKNSKQAYSAKEIANHLEPDYSMQTPEAMAAVMYDLALQSLAYQDEVRMKKTGHGKNETNYYKLI